MRLRIVVCLSLVLPSCTKTPQEATRLYVVRVSNGFEHAGGVVVGEHHLITSLRPVIHVNEVEILTTDRVLHTARVASRHESLKIALLQTDAILPAPPFGSTGEILKGDTIVTQSFDSSGVVTQHSGRLTAWDYAEGLAHMETTLEIPPEALGGGVFGPFGNLLGVITFKLPPDRTYLLPIEQIANGKGAVTSSFLEVREDDDAYAATRAEAANHPDKQVTKMRYEEVTNTYSFGSSTLLGAVTLMESTSDPVHDQPVSFQLDAIDSGGKRQSLSSGSIPAKDLRWLERSKDFGTIKKEMEEAFGELWVTDFLTPNDYGDLRYRVDISALCQKAQTLRAAHLQLQLSDGRTPPSLVFDDIQSRCNGDTAVDSLAQEWFREGPQTKGKSKSKSKAKAKGKRRKKKRRRR